MPTSAAGTHELSCPLLSAAGWRVLPGAGSERRASRPRCPRWGRPSRPEREAAVTPVPGGQGGREGSPASGPGSGQRRAETGLVTASVGSVARKNRELRGGSVSKAFCKAMWVWRREM